MNRLDQVLVISVISFLALIGCSNTKQASTETTSAVSPASTVAASPQAVSGKGTDGLLAVVSNTKVPVEAGDFAKAKQEFEKFEDIWKNVEDGIKVKSPDGYKAIEENMDEIMGGLKASTPSKEKVLAALQSLEKNINSVPKS